nr:lysozyme [Hymenobacter fodinae]
MWTIGWGHTKGVCAGLTCTIEQAEAWLQQDLADAIHTVETGVKVRLTDNQFAALVIFAFNVGVGSFKSSTLLRMLNQGHYNQVPRQLLRWNKGRVGGKLVVIPGLTNRRNAEIDLWQTV